MNGAANKLINHVRLKPATAVVRACAHPLRLKLMAHVHSKRVVNVNSIYRSLKLEQSVTSQHLKILRDARLVLAERDGKLVYYKLNYRFLQKIAGLMDKLF